CVVLCYSDPPLAEEESAFCASNQSRSVSTCPGVPWICVDLWRKDFAVALGFAFQFWHFWQFWQPVPACRGWSCSRPFAFIRGPMVFLSVLVLVFLLLPVAYCLLPAFLPCCLLPVACCLDEI